MTTTALDIITGAAKLLGVLNKGENLDANDAADGLVSLNDLIASWANDSLLVYTRTEETFSLVGGTASYSIGAGQTWDTVKPVRILEAQIRDSANLDYAMDIINDEEYQNINFKGNSTSLPDSLNYNNGHPYGTVNIYPTPSSSYSIRLLTEKPLTAFALTSTTVDLPAGWNRALRFNLAVDMAPEFLKAGEIDPLVVMGAKESKGAIKSAVLKSRPLLSTDVMYGKRGSIYSGFF